MVPRSRRTVLQGVAASAVALAGCTGPAFSIPLTVTNSTENRLSATVSLSEKKLFDGQSRTWRLDLGVDETTERRLGGGGRPADRFRLEVDPAGRERVRSTLRNPQSVAVDVGESRITVTVAKFSGETTETTAVTETTQRTAPRS